MSDSFRDFWSTIVVFAFIAYLLILYRDDHQTTGCVKAMWAVSLGMAWQSRHRHLKRRCVNE
jgi:hypothetical protein